MSDLECFSCDRRQVCEPVFADIAKATITNVAKSEGPELDLNPMDAISMLKALSDTATTGNTTELEQLAGRLDFNQFKVGDEDPMMDGYNKLREAGCTLDGKQFGIRMAQYVNGNMLSIIGMFVEEAMVQEMSDQVDTFDAEEERLKGVLGAAGAEISGILGDMETVTSDDPELRDLVGGTMSELENILSELRSIPGYSTQHDSYETPERPVRLTLEERKAKARADFITSQGWEEDNLDLGQKLELKAHLREIGLIR